MPIFIPGLPVPKGNHKAFTFRSRRTGRQTIRIVDQGGAALKDWQNKIAAHVKELIEKPFAQPWAISLDVVFYLPRPKCHFTKTGKPSSKWRLHHTTKPDRDKLLRAVQDALIGIAYVDDNQVFDGRVKKDYADYPHTVGVEITITIC